MLTEEEKEILKQAPDMEDLVRSPAWKTLSSIVNQMLLAKTNEAFRDVESIFDILSVERAKGAALTLKVLLALPLGIITHAELIRKENLRQDSGEDS